MDKAKIQPGVDFIAHHEDFMEINGLSYSEIGKLFCAILTYTADGSVMDGLSPQTKVIFAFIRRHIDRDKMKYEDIKSKRSEAGKLGGRPKKSGFEKQTKPNKANGYFGYDEESKKSLPVPDPVPDLVPDPVPDSNGAAAAATYDDGKSGGDMFENRDKRIHYLKAMLRLYENKALCDPEMQQIYQEELDSLLQGGDG